MSTRTVERIPVIGETEAQALHRLARQAHQKGCQIVVDDQNRHWVTSASRPGHKHVVTLYTCDCVGFAHYGRCMHYALVLEAYHSLPPIDPDPTPSGGIAVERDGSPVEGVEVGMAYGGGAWTLTVASREGLQEILFRDRERHVAQSIEKAIAAGTPARLTRTERGGPELTLGYRVGLGFDPAPVVTGEAVARAA